MGGRHDRVLKWGGGETRVEIEKDALFVSTSQTNFLIYSEAADSNLYIRKCFQIFKISTYILGNFSEYISLHHCLRIY